MSDRNPRAASCLRAALLILAALVVPAGEGAALPTGVRHTFHGELTRVEHAVDFPDLAVGQPFEIVVAYDFDLRRSLSHHPRPGIDPLRRRATFAGHTEPVDPSDPRGEFRFTSNPIEVSLRVAGQLISEYTAPTGPVPRSESVRQPSLERTLNATRPLDFARPDETAYHEIVEIRGGIFSVYLHRPDLQPKAPDPTLPILLDAVDWSFAEFGVQTIRIEPGVGAFHALDFGGRIDEITSKVIPEPGAALLLALGLAVLARRAR